MMGTRSTTSFYDGEDHLVTFYRQYDGYPTYYGAALANWIDTCEIVNGFASDMEGGSHANGVGCLVAQLVSHWKGDDGPLGGLYIQPEDTKNSQDYHYDVVFDDDDNCEITVYRWGKYIGTFTPNELANNAADIEGGSAE